MRPLFEWILEIFLCVAIGFRATPCLAEDLAVPVPAPNVFEWGDEAMLAHEWNDGISDAGRPLGGLVAHAFVSPGQPIAGKPVTFIFSLKNLNDRPATFKTKAEGRTGPFEIRTKGGALVEPGLSEAPKIQKGSFAKPQFEDITIAPGHAVRITGIYGDRKFDIREPGTYVALAGLSLPCYGIGSRNPLDQRDSVVASAVTFMVRNRGSDSSGKPARKPSDVPAEFHSDDAFEKQWRDAVTLSRRDSGGPTLQALLSPVDPIAVNLVVSLANLRPAETGDSQPGVAYDRGLAASDYLILVRDAAGNAVPLTAAGRALLHHGSRQERGLLRPGEAIGAVFKLDEVFEIEPGRDYSAIAVLPGKNRSDPVRAAPPVEFRAPRREVVGLDRPPYGSSRLWDKMLAIPGDPDFRLSLEGTVETGEDSITLGLELKKLMNRPISEDFLEDTANITILVKDEHGIPVLPNRNSKAYRVEWRGTDGDLRSPGPRALETTVPIGLLYPLRPGGRYSLLAANNIIGEFTTLVVSKPMEFTVPAVRGEGNKPRGDTAAGESAKPKARIPEPTLEEYYRQLVRFAGKPYHGLQLDVSQEWPLKFRVSLSNRSNQPILVKKWKGRSDFALLIRAPSGKVKLISATDPKFAGKALEIHDLKPNDVITFDVMLDDLPVPDLDFGENGEYVILPCLPIIGDEDAVLTAAPIKVGSDEKPAVPKK